MKNRSSKTQPGKPSQSSPGLFGIDVQITARCNRRCAHCYQESYDQPDPSWEQLHFLITQCRDFLDEAEDAGIFREIASPVRARLSLTGGEPVLSPNFLRLMKEVSLDVRHFSGRFLTNGTLIHAQLAKRLKDLPLEVVSVSIDGMEKTHDLRRGKGSFRQAIRGIEHLLKESIPTVVSFSADRLNYRDIPEVAEMVKKLGVRRFWSDRCLPLGRMQQANVLNAEETRTYVGLLQSTAKALDDEDGRFKVLTHRALQFLPVFENEGPPFGRDIYQCSAGLFTLCIQANGDVYPCRRLPIKAGNLWKTPLTRIYLENRVMKELRRRNTPSLCRACRYAAACNGGLRCFSHAALGSWRKADPGCWLAGDKPSA